MVRPCHPLQLLDAEESATPLLKSPVLYICWLSDLPMDAWSTHQGIQPGSFQELSIPNTEDRDEPGPARHKVVFPISTNVYLNLRDLKNGQIEPGNQRQELVFLTTAACVLLAAWAAAGT